jgi:hypothetical protein
MISDQDKGIIVRQALPAVLSELLFVILPYASMQLSGRLQDGPVMQVQVANRI